MIHSHLAITAKARPLHALLVDPGAGFHLRLHQTKIVMRVAVGEEARSNLGLAPYQFQAADDVVESDRLFEFSNEKVCVSQSTWSKADNGYSARGHIVLHSGGRLL